MRTSHRLLVLTAVSVSLELVLLSTCLRRGESIAITAILLTAFHLGYLLADPASTLRTSLLGLAGAGALALSGALLWGGVSPIAAVPVLAGSALVQGLRRQLKAKGRSSARVKNVVKLVAMIVGGAVSGGAGPFLLGLALAVLLATMRLDAVRLATTPSPTTATSAPLPPMSLVATELLHHAHYFAYCYTFWRLLDHLPLVGLGALFSVGWLAYFVAEVVIGARLSFSPRALAAGHLLCATCLIGMAHVTSLLPMMSLWFMTGVGGGLAYMLGNGPQHPRRELAEDAGHVLGTLAAGVLGSVVDARATLYLGVAAAVATAACSLVVHSQLSKLKGNDASSRA